jgi:dephospho-CoA kinase
MLLVGLTGGIASGKTVVSNNLRDLGAHVIDADDISRAVMVPETKCWKKLVENFGDTILKKDSSIDRKILASLIFDDPQKRKCLNDIVHPEITKRINQKVALINAEHSDAIVIIEAALLVETGAYKKYEKLIVVYAKEDLQEERIINRDGITRGEARKRIEAQWPMAKKMKVADYLIQNEGSLELLCRDTERVFARLRSLSDLKNPQQGDSDKIKEKHTNNT